LLTYLFLSCILVLEGHGVTLLGVGSIGNTMTQLVSFDSNTLSMNIIQNYSNTLIWDGGIGTCTYDSTSQILYFVSEGYRFYKVSGVNGVVLGTTASKYHEIYEIGVNGITGDVFVVGPPSNFDPVSRTLGIYKLDFLSGLSPIGSIANGLGHGIVELAAYMSSTNTFYFQPFVGTIIGYNTQLKKPVASILPLNYTLIACVSDPYIFGFNGRAGDRKTTVIRINVNTYEVEPLMNFEPYFYSVPPGAVYDKTTNTLYFFAFEELTVGNTYLITANLGTKTFKAQNIPWAAWSKGGINLQNVWIQ